MKPLGLFQAYGIEIEYMIVDRISLNPLAITDKLLESFAGEIVSDYADGAITWSNELVLHVIELKTTSPAKALQGLDLEFARSITKLNSRLNETNACLLPTAMHPLLNPEHNVALWPHDNNEIYSTFEHVFETNTHGWRNLQSTHINLPFASDEEFVRLHRAIRLVMPLIPAIAASSPLIEGSRTHALDNRLLQYERNQRQIPSITGSVIPEPISSIDEYHRKILTPMYRDIARFDPDGILQEEWLNSRGAIARFDRNTIEIRVMDSQECPRSDLALAAFFSAMIEDLCSTSATTATLELETEELKSIFDQAVQTGLDTEIKYAAFLKSLNFPDELQSGFSMSSPDISDEAQIGLTTRSNDSSEETLSGHSMKSNNISEKTLSGHSMRSNIISNGSLSRHSMRLVLKAALLKPSIRKKLSADQINIVSTILEQGSLAERVLKCLPQALDHSAIINVYRKLATCLAHNTLFLPDELKPGTSPRKMGTRTHKSLRPPERET